MNRLAGLMALVAGSLAVMSCLHLGGKLSGSPPFDPTRAGVAEAVIGVVLFFGALALLRRAPHAWGIALAATAVAVVGFVVGLTRTTQGGGAIDIGYHVAVLPLLLLALAVLLRPVTPRRSSLR